MSRLTQGAPAGRQAPRSPNLDDALRGRPPSSVPQEDVQRLAERAGVSLGDDESGEARKSGLGALLGYVTGFGMGVAFGAAAPALTRRPRPLSAVLVGVGATAATDAGSVRLKTTDPRSWSAQDWLADIVPHLAYGAGVVVTYDALSR
jgi:F0F1-type ATP synthase membrane subunit c/vacuolar-type H+-ATPase subunit K